MLSMLPCDTGVRLLMACFEFLRHILTPPASGDTMTTFSALMSAA